MDNISEKYETELYFTTEPTSHTFNVLIQDVISNLELNIQNSSKFSGKHHIILKDSPNVQIHHEKGSQNEGYLIKLTVLDTSDNINIKNNKQILKEVYNQIEDVFPNVQPMN